MTRYFDVHTGSSGPEGYVDILVKRFGEDEKGHKLISPQMRSETEVDHQVDLLIAELNEVREQAKKELRKQSWETVPGYLSRTVST